MKGLTKKKGFLYGLVTLFLALILAVFCIPKNAKSANAYDGTFYFRENPTISATATDGRYPIKFNLIISNKALSTSDAVTVTLSGNSTSSYIQRDHTGTTLSEYDVEGTNQSVTFSYNVLVFEEGYASVYVDMYLNINETGRLTATCNGTSAVTDEYTVISVIEIASNDGYDGYTESDAQNLALLYDKYAGKDTTKETGNLSLTSNIVPSYSYHYTSTSPMFSAEVEIPANVANLLRNNTSVEWDSFNNGLSGEYYDVSGKYYALCMTVSNDNPTSQANNGLKYLSNATRQFYYGGKAYSQYLYTDIQNSTSLPQALRSTIYSRLNGYSYANNLGLVKNAQGALTSISTDATTKKVLNFATNTCNLSKTAQYYFYAEVLEFSFDVRYTYYNSQYKADNGNIDVSTVYRSEFVNTSIQGIAEDLLTKNASLSATARDAVCAWGGIDTTTEVPLEVIYKTYSASGNYETKSNVYSIGKASVYNKHSAVDAMYALSGLSDISAFNIVSTRMSYDSVTGNLYNTGDQILRQALYYDYVYSTDEGKAYATVVYDEYLYKDFFITIRNNSPDCDPEVNYYTANVEVVDGVATLTFNYADVEERLLNACGWLFEIERENVTVVGSSDALLAVTVDDTEIVVRVPVKYQSDLFGLEISIMAEIVPDEEYAVKYEYVTDVNVSTDGKIELLTETVDGEPLLLSKIKNYNNFNVFMKDKGNEINAPLSAFELEYGVRYATAQDVFVDTDSTSKTATILVTYQTYSLLKISDNLTDEWKYIQASHTTNVYTGDEFVKAIGGVPASYRVDKIESQTGVLRITNEYDYKDTRAVLNADTYGGYIYPAKVVFTDKWNVNINYMEQFKQTPFAEKTCYSGEIRVADFPDIYTLSSSDLATILGKESMAIINNKTTVDTITVWYDGIGTYNVNTTYTHMSMAKTDYNGSVEEQKIPLTCYADWCENYGKDWSILYLNFCGNNYFKYSNDVKRENLYGFFSTAVFEEQVSDLNFIFKDMKGTGCITIHESEEVRGSKIYKFFGDLRGGWLGVAGYIGMAFCEVLNDENAIYHSYFFFLDGTKDIAVLAQNGATDANDTDSALKNTVDGAVDTVGGWWDGIKNSVGDSTLGKVFAVLIPIIVVIIVGALVIWFVRWLFNKGK